MPSLSMGQFEERQNGGWAHSCGGNMPCSSWWCPCRARPLAGAILVGEKPHKALVLSGQVIVSGQKGEEEAELPFWKFLTFIP